MNVAMIARDSIFTGAGGDTVQMESTAKELRKLGVNVKIYRTSDKIDYSSFQLLHFFNLIRPNDILPHIRRAKLPFLVSTIYVDYSKLEKSSGGFVYKLLHKLFSKHFIEYLKVLGRHFLSGEKLQSRYYLWHGHYKSINYVLKNASFILPNSKSEYLRLSSDFEFKTNYRVIPNGISLRDYSNIQNHSVDPDTIVCVGRIESRKNQLNLIRAIKETPFKLTLIGKSSPNQQAYFNLCLKEGNELGSRFKYLDYLPHNEVLKQLGKSAIHVLPSWFETTGLVNLEAAMCGCEIVITEFGDTKDYFKNYAHYCSPNSVDSIKDAIVKARNFKQNEQLQKLIQQNYTWEIAAKKTKQAYELALESN